MPFAIVTVGAPESTIEVSVAATTVSPVLPLTVPEVAVIVVVPLSVSAVSNPPGEVIVAVVVFDELQVTVEVRFCVDPSLYVPVAVNCVRVPSGTEAFAGVTAIESSVAAVTFSVALPVMPLTVAVIVVVHGVKALANPPGAMVAYVTFDEAHASVEVRGWLLPSLYVPIAVNCSVRPAATDEVSGATAIDTSVGTTGVTFSVAVPTTPPTVAVIVTDPVATPVANPPGDVIVAIVVFDEVHFAVAVRFCVLLLLYVPVAVNCCCWPAATEGVAGVTAIEMRLGAAGDELPLLHPTSSPANTTTRHNRRFFMGRVST